MKVWYSAAFVLLCVAISLTIALMRARKRKPKKATHIFLDLETMGIKHDSAVVVIAAYKVNELGVKLGDFQRRIDLESARRFGEEDKGTMEWWGKQDKDARFNAFERGPRWPLESALEALSEFVKDCDTEPFIWGNAPTFDCTILRHAYAQTNLKTPWDFWQEMDVRTVSRLCEIKGHDIKQNTKFIGTRHDALHDARHQANYTMASVKALKVEL